MTPRPISSCLAHFRRAALLNGETGPTDGQLLGEFVAQRDEAAFAALVKRHASMVFGVCRRLVGDVHVAEDAFQAVFIVLARRASSIRPREAIGNWLYGVAYRTALKARSMLARRRSREKQVVVMPHPEVLPQEVWHDVQAVLDVELNQLPDQLRLPVVLCDLEGRPQREVARQLKLPPATLANRLATARRRLADRLRKRGIALSGGALAATITSNSAHASVPATLISQVSDYARTIAAGASVVGAVSTHAIQLSEGVMRMLFLTKLRKLTACAVAALVLACGFGAAALSAADTDETTAPKTQSPATAEATAKPTQKKLDDKEYLRRVCLDLRGDAPTEVEMIYFLADRDEHKRSKVVEWLLEDPQAQAWRHVRSFKSKIAANQCTACHQGVAIHDLDGRLNTNVWHGWNHLPVERIDINQIGQPNVDSGELQAATGRGVQDVDTDWLIEVDAPTTTKEFWAELALEDSDEGFLRRACQEARGSAPTHLEIEYFKADKDPKKREKLLDMLLKDAAAAKKLGDGWKQKMLQQRFKVTSTFLNEFTPVKVHYYRVDARTTVPERLVQLLDKLLKDKRSDDQVLEALSLATLGRLPTESEKKLVIDSVAKQQDKPAAWRDVLSTFARTNEAKQYAEELNRGSKPKQ